MDKNINRNKLFMIISICVLGIALIGSTVAYYTRELFSTGEQDTITYGLDYYINYAKGQDVVSATLNPTLSYEGSPSSDIEFWKKDDTYDIYGHIYLDINSMSDALSSSGALKYVILNNNNVIKEGVVTNNSNTMLLAKDIPLKTSKQLYTVHIWLDDTMDLDSSMTSETLSLSVRCEATMKKIGGGAAEYITSLYLNNKNKVVTNNNIEYQYAEDVNLMNDRLGGITKDYDAGNIRYYGANPNNYVDIGDRTSTGEIIPYRIIGVFKDMELADGAKKDLIKVIRVDSIGGYPWDTKLIGVGSSTRVDGSEDWTDARLMMLLNPGYDKYSTSNPFRDTSGNIIYGYEGSLWWNSKSGTCYSGYYIKSGEGDTSPSESGTNPTQLCDFTSRGLSVEAQLKIEEVVWSLGDSFFGNFSNDYYESERGEVFSSGRPAKWTGRVALMYISDYGYATDFNVCGKIVSFYGSKVHDEYRCSDFIWLQHNGWLLNPRDDQFNAFNLESLTLLGAPFYNDLNVYPAFYLRSDLNIISGSGQPDDPYVIN